VRPVPPVLPSAPSPLPFHPFLFLLDVLDRLPRRRVWIVFRVPVFHLSVLSFHVLWFLSRRFFLVWCAVPVSVSSVQVEGQASVALPPLQE